MAASETVHEQSDPISLTPGVHATNCLAVPWNLVMQHDLVAVRQRYQLPTTARLPLKTGQVAAENRLGMSAANEGMRYKR